jgi:hypothetical protein
MPKTSNNKPEKNTDINEDIFPGYTFNKFIKDSLLSFVAALVILLACAAFFAARMYFSPESYFSCGKSLKSVIAKKLCIARGTAKCIEKAAACGGAESAGFIRQLAEKHPGTAIAAPLITAYKNAPADAKPDMYLEIVQKYAGDTADKMLIDAAFTDIEIKNIKLPCTVINDSIAAMIITATAADFDNARYIGYFNGCFTPQQLAMAAAAGSNVQKNTVLQIAGEKMLPEYAVCIDPLLNDADKEIKKNARRLRRSLGN